MDVDSGRPAGLETRTHRRITNPFLKMETPVGAFCLVIVRQCCNDFTYRKLCMDLQMYFPSCPNGFNGCQHVDRVLIPLRSSPRGIAKRDSWPEHFFLISRG